MAQSEIWGERASLSASAAITTPGFLPKHPPPTGDGGRLHTQKLRQFFLGMGIKADAPDGGLYDQRENPGIGDDETGQKSMGPFAVFTVHSMDGCWPNEEGVFLG